MRLGYIASVVSALSLSLVTVSEKLQQVGLVKVLVSPLVWASLGLESGLLTELIRATVLTFFPEKLRLCSSWISLAGSQLSIDHRLDDLKT